MEFALFKTVLYWSFECVEGSIPFNRSIDLLMTYKRVEENSVALSK